ncbi:class I SAM-dependent RNA methyltransferase [Canibacter zhoujuaniae]|uniref:class I SAM-dependent RNA methyltransferase n=1 Tax=Canibacter zhoujuaniae TaxID=2708343 RepID=UPI001AB021EF|nr:TRAM domain-containing protein [Canibacter zhoujuaniae]
MTTSAELHVGDDVVLDITGIAHGGVSVARHSSGRVVFVSDTLPGEQVRARIIELKKNFARAVTVQVLQPSPFRTAHVWAEADISRDPQDRVGGAEFGHIALGHQRDLKAQVLRDALIRQGRIAADAVPNVSIDPLLGDDYENGLGWRTRVSLHTDPETGIVGPYAARSHRVIPVKSLPLASDQLSLIAPLDERMPDVTRVDLVAPSADDPRMLLTYRCEKAPVGAADVVYEAVNNRDFQVRAGGFWQVHRGAAERLYGEVSAAVTALGDAVDPTGYNLDLYGGVGLLAAAFIDAAGERAKITSIESVESATDLAAENLADFAGAQALTAKVEHYLRDLYKGSAIVRDRLKKGTVIIDPPRAGAGNAVTGSLIALQPKNIVYVACDPVALARDTQTLLADGYDLLEIHGLDMFPHTHHFETITLFQR